MSSSNYRGLRSPWAILLLGTIFFALALSGPVFGLTHHPTRWPAIIIIVVFFGAGSAIIYTIGFKRLRWMRSVGMNPWRPEVRDQRSSFGRMLPPDDE